MDKLSKGKSNFETVLASQNCVFGKSSLGFYPQNKKNGISKPFSKVPEKQPIERSKHSVVTCFYCMKRGHSVRRLGNILLLKVFYNGFSKVVRFQVIKTNQKDPRL